jgi:hypothetical protein
MNHRFGRFFLVGMIFLALSNQVSNIFFFHRRIENVILERNDKKIPTEISRSVVDPPEPKLVWLMSFPNSGTSFTTKMVRQSANQYTATNYGEEHMHQDGFSIPLPSNDNAYRLGPFLSESLSNHKHTKKRSFGKLILTKTHCGGRCSRCDPLSYIEDLESFKRDCLTARRGFTHYNGTLAFEKSQYDEKLVRKAIHLIRDPFDNIVSRFHLTHKINKKTGDKSFAKSFPNTDKGFKKWCNFMDKKYVKQESIAFDPLILKLFKHVPCHADFYRYVMWHNLAFEVVESMGIPSTVLHYEDYEEDFNSTKAEIFSFLETEEATSTGRRNTDAFVSGKSYGHFFTGDERKAIQNLVYKLSSTDTRREVTRYFSN